MVLQNAFAMHYICFTSGVLLQSNCNVFKANALFYLEEENPGSIYGNCSDLKQ
jgi:hypothetical protein